LRLTWRRCLLCRRARARRDIGRRRLVVVSRGIAGPSAERILSRLALPLALRQTGAAGRKRLHFGLWRRLRLRLRRLRNRRGRIWNLQHRRRRRVVDTAVIGGRRADRDRAEIPQVRLDRRSAGRIRQDVRRSRRRPVEIARRSARHEECLKHSLRRQIEDEVGAAIDGLLRDGEFQVAEEAWRSVGLVERAGNGKRVLVEPLDAARRRGIFPIDRKPDPVELDLAAVDAGKRFGIVPVAQPLQLVPIIRAVIDAVEHTLDVAPLSRGVGELVGIARSLAGTFDDFLAAIEPVGPRLTHGRLDRSGERHAEHGADGGQRTPAQDPRSITPPGTHHARAIRPGPQTGKRSIRAHPVGCEGSIMT
jgi:hypothetical protein